MLSLLIAIKCTICCNPYVEKYKNTQITICLNNYLNYNTKLLHQKKKNSELALSSMILLCTELTQFPLMPVELMFDSSHGTLKNEGPLSRASWKANRIAKRANSGFKFKFQLSLSCAQSFLWADLPCSHGTHTSQDGIFIQGLSKITFTVSQSPTSSAGWMLQDTFSLGSFQASKTDFRGEQRQGSSPLVFAVAGWVHKQLGTMGHNKLLCFRGHRANMCQRWDVHALLVAVCSR